jgi:hypothetical protein
MIRHIRSLASSLSSNPFVTSIVASLPLPIPIMISYASSPRRPYYVLSPPVRPPSGRFKAFVCIRQHASFASAILQLQWMKEEHY